MGVVRAQGLPQETVVYGLDEEAGLEGVFEIDSDSGEIVIGPNGSNSLVIQVYTLNCRPHSLSKKK